MKLVPDVHNGCPLNQISGGVPGITNMPDVDLLSVDEARARVLAAVTPLRPVRLPLDQTLGLMLAEQLAAPMDLPPFPNSAMDGYAVRADETRSASPTSPVVLRVVATVAAGDRPGAAMAGGEAVRIMTGAPLPSGADSVLRFEDTDEPGGVGRAAGAGQVAILRPVTPAENVRAAGEELRSGQIVLSSGTLLDPAGIGLLASLGIDRVLAYRRPRVGVLSTGSELASPGHPLPPGQIFDANGAMIRALVVQSGALAVSFGVTGDRADEIDRRLSAAGDVNLIIVSGGVSTGDYDLVKDVLQARGNVAVWQVRLKPGKALAFGFVGGVPLLGLPGNPVAAAVSFEVFARPLMAKLAGRGELSVPSLNARLVTRIPNHGRRRQYARAYLERSADGTLVASAASDQSTSKLSVLGHVNALVVIAETVDVAEAGMMLPVIVLERDPEKLVSLLGSGPSDPPSAAAGFNRNELE